MGEVAAAHGLRRVQGRVMSQRHERVLQRSAGARVRVRGPRSHVEALTKAPTETISVNDRTQSFTSQQISVDIPDPKVIALDGFVSVRVEIGPK